jgi:hypothetical protein
MRSDKIQRLVGLRVEPGEKINVCRVPVKGLRAHIDALGILQAFLKDTQHGVGLQIHDEVWTSRKYTIRAFAETRVRALGHAKGLCLEGMPRTAAIHRIISEIADGVYRFPSGTLGRFVRERVEEETFEGG